jgi:hypothetical protein
MPATKKLQLPKYLETENLICAHKTEEVHEKYEQQDT